MHPGELLRDLAGPCVLGRLLMHAELNVFNMLVFRDLFLIMPLKDHLKPGMLLMY